MQNLKFTKYLKRNLLKSNNVLIALIQETALNQAFSSAPTISNCIKFQVLISFCTFKKAMGILEKLTQTGANIIPIMSEMSYSTDTRFGKAEDFRTNITNLTGNNIICCVKDAEPIGPKNLLDLLVVLPCTGNTLAKIANGIADTSVTMAVKAHLRNQKPVLLAVSTNDGLGTAAKNIGTLLNCKNLYFLPFSQDKGTGYLIQFNNLYPWCILAQAFYRKN